MADKFYLIRTAVVTPAMQAKAAAEQDYTFFKVTGLNVSGMDTLLSSVNEDNWFSGDIADSTSERGYQTDGIVLPKKAVDS